MSSLPNIDDEGRRFYYIWKQVPDRESTVDATIASYNVYEEDEVRAY